jgi:YD repeat-containing protein
MTSQTVNGTALAFGYDLDGLLTGAGALTLTLDTQNGHLNGTTLGAMTDSYGYDTNGLFASYTAKFSGSSLYAESVLRDAIGRITQKTETVQGTTHVWGYTFDPAGRLTDVTEDGSFFSHVVVTFPLLRAGRTKAPRRFDLRGAGAFGLTLKRPS